VHLVGATLTTGLASRSLHTTPTGNAAPRAPTVLARTAAKAIVVSGMAIRIFPAAYRTSRRATTYARWPLPMRTGPVARDLGNGPT
jgi:hypothetical protein